LMQSLVFLPLRSSNRIIGALTLASVQSGRYAEDDLPLLGELAHHAAVALSNAKLHGDLQEAARNLTRANQAKDEFLGLVSHELRTPITVVLGNSHHLLRRELALDGEERCALEDIYIEAERLSRIIENLLVLARLDQGQEIEKGPVHLERVVELVCKAFKQSNPEREIVVETGEGLPYALGFQMYVEQILRNLLSNAIKYSPTYEPIELRITADDSSVEVEVRDHGRTIAVEERENIFQAFYRTDDEEHAHKQGVGIGLSVCQRLVDVMGGTIWVEPGAGGGNVFAFKLPVDYESSC
jgi:signal transduction histidine kinase